MTKEIQSFVDGTGEANDPREEFQLNSHLLHNQQLLSPFTKVPLAFSPLVHRGSNFRQFGFVEAPWSLEATKVFMA